MTKRLPALSLAALLLWAAPAWAQLKITGPASVPRDKMAELSAEGQAAGAALVWDVSPEEAADVKECSAGRLLIVGPPGTYRIKCRAVSVGKDGAVKIETARATLTVGDAPPPGPGPGPNPPPVPPTDPLAKAVQAAWLGEASATKGADAAALASVYRAGQGAAPSAGTWGALVQAMAAKAKDAGAVGKLPGVQKAVDDDFQARWNVAPGSAVGDGAAVAAYFGKVAGIVEALRP